MTMADLLMYEALQREHAAIARAHPFAPGTTEGARQGWLRENIARAIEGKEPLPWPDDARGKETPPASDSNR